jgi:hypothetical protein
MRSVAPVAFASIGHLLFGRLCYGYVVTEAAVPNIGEAIAQLTGAVQAAVPHLRSSLEHGARQYAAAALVDASDLLDCGLVLLDGTRTPSAMGAIARTVLDRYFTGLFVLYGGSEALFHIDRARNSQLRKYANANEYSHLLAAGLDHREQQLNDAEQARQAVYGVKWPGIPERLSIESMAKHASAMAETATGEKTDLVRVYDRFYRAFSFLDVHGLGPVDKHIDLHDDGISMKPAGYWLSAGNHLLVAALYTSNLAQGVFKQFGLSDTAVVSAQDDLMSIAQGIFESLPTIEEAAAPFLEQR